MKILIVEDEESIAEGLRFNFEQEGYQAVVASDGVSALKLLSKGACYNLVVLDLMLPGISGYEICKEIRTFDTTIPIMVLSARSTSQDKAHAFDCGADQYVTKPFDLNEVLSRVRNLIQSRLAIPPNRSVEKRNVVVEFGNVKVDCSSYQVVVAGKSNSLTLIEMQLLRYFLDNEGVVLSRAQILSDVWGYDSVVTTRTIDNFVMRLRRLLEPDPLKPCHILSIRGKGYRFVSGR